MYLPVEKVLFDTVSVTVFAGTGMRVSVPVLVNRLTTVTLYPLMNPWGVLGADHEIISSAAPLPTACRLVTLVSAG